MVKIAKRRPSVKIEKRNRRSVKIEKWNRRSVKIEKWNRRSVKIEKWNRPSVKIEKRNRPSVKIEKQDRDILQLRRLRELLYDNDAVLSNHGAAIKIKFSRLVIKIKVSRLVKFLGEGYRNSVKVDAALVLAKAKPPSEVDDMLRPVFQHLFSIKSINLRCFVCFGLHLPHEVPRLVAMERLEKLLPVKLFYGKINEIKESGVLPALISFVGVDGGLDLEAEAATKVLLEFSFGAMGSHRDLLIQHKVLPVLIQLFGSQNCDVREKAVGLVAMFMASCSSSGGAECDHVGSLDILSTLLVECEREGNSDGFMLEASHLLLSICTFEPLSESSGGRVVKFLFEVLQHKFNDIILKRGLALEYACSTLSYLSSNTLDYLRPIINGNFFSCLLKLIEDSPNEYTRQLALSVVLNIVQLDIAYLKVFMEGGILRLLGAVVESYMMEGSSSFQSKRKNKEMACTIIELCIKDGGVQSVIDAGVISKVVSLIGIIKNDFCNAPFDKGELKFLAAHAIKTAIEYGDADQISTLVDMRCIDALCKCRGVTIRSC